MIDRPGVYDIPIADYLSDPAPEPSFSASVGKTLMQLSPKHAWLAHPRLGGGTTHEPSARADFGSVVHELVLEHGAQFRVLEFDDFRTKAAKEARELAVGDGLVSIKTADFERAEAAADAIRAQLPDLFAQGKAEQTLIWRDGPAWCRARPDWLGQDANLIYDLKITGVNMSQRENALHRHIFAEWYDFSVAHYHDGYSTVFGEELIDYIFLFVESRPPFSIRPVKLSGQALEMGRRKLAVARAWWKNGIATDRWPGMAMELEIADPEPWHVAGWLTHEDGSSEADVEQAMEAFSP
ncbi:MAG: PD-(D/E)XK nuclease-like domain-containing protein [Gammaproteobacteria bacterium]